MIERQIGEPGPAESDRLLVAADITTLPLEETPRALGLGSTLLCKGQGFAATDVLSALTG